ncbi:hypothetical protein VCRA2120E57_160021 [Vibrio crassostreae]|nr:hypothetical protein VCRA2120E57_160021 [Vibrio crassostreae]
MKASTFFIGCNIKADLLLRSFVALGDDDSFNYNAFSHNFPINTNSLLSSVFRHSQEEGTTELGISRHTDNIW